MKRRLRNLTLLPDISINFRQGWIWTALSRETFVRYGENIKKMQTSPGFQEHSQNNPGWVVAISHLSRTLFPERNSIEIRKSTIYRITWRHLPEYFLKSHAMQLSRLFRFWAPKFTNKLVEKTKWESSFVPQINFPDYVLNMIFLRKTWSVICRSATFQIENCQNTKTYLNHNFVIVVPRTDKY